MRKHYWVIMPSSAIESRHEDAKPCVCDNMQRLGSDLARWGSMRDHSKANMRGYLEGQKQWTEGQWLTFEYDNGYVDVLYAPKDR